MDEKERILTSIDTANAIAVSLSKFDLQQAKAQLEDADIPEGLSGAFRQILLNLCTYKPYLPQSCIPDGYEDEDDESEVTHSSVSTGGKSTPSDSPPSSVQLETVACKRRKFDKSKASLMVINIRESFAVLVDSHVIFGSLISDLVSATSEVIVNHRGTLDLFLGDRVFANFGASRIHVTHPTSCVNAALAITSLSDKMLDPYQSSACGRLSVNIGIASGKVVCGDLGSDDIIRFSVIGKMSLLVDAVERFATLKGVPILSEEGMYRQVKDTHEVRVHLQTLLFNDVEHVLYEFIPSKGDAVVAEWMYQLEESGVGKWSAYNDTAITILGGGESPALGLVAEFQELRQLAEKGRPKPFILSR